MLKIRWNTDQSASIAVEHSQRNEWNVLGVPNGARLIKYWIMMSECRNAEEKQVNRINYKLFRLLIWVSILFLCLVMYTCKNNVSFERDPEEIYFYKILPAVSPTFPWYKKYAMSDHVLSERIWWSLLPKSV